MGTDAFFPDPARQQTGTPANQQDGMPASQFVKATFYLTPELVLKLEQVRYERLQRGERIDKSALVREAIAQLAS
jgi:hypothetical protein